MGQSESLPAAPRKEAKETAPLVSRVANPPVRPSVRPLLPARHISPVVKIYFRHATTKLYLPVTINDFFDNCGSDTVESVYLQCDELVVSVTKLHPRRSSHADTFDLSECEKYNDDPRPTVCHRAHSINEGYAWEVHCPLRDTRYSLDMRFDLYIKSGWICLDRSITRAVLRDEPRTADEPRKAEAGPRTPQRRRRTEAELLAS
jgi:hypothetical protein